MKILLFGNTGQVGWELQRTCNTLGEVVAIDYPEIDLVSVDSVRELIQRVKPVIIINAAAYTNVDKAEGEPELARKVNAIAPGIMAKEAKKLNAVFIHYSTDYVFDGTKGSLYVETDPTCPVNIYGATKLEGEQLIQSTGGAYVIFRTSWVYNLHQGGFVNKVLEWAHEQKTIRVVDDQISSPTWARMLAEATAQVIAQGSEDPLNYFNGKNGLYHLAGNSFASRFEWALMIMKLDPKRHEQRVKKIIPALTSDFPFLAQRPKNSALDCQKFMKTFALYIPFWETSLFLAMNTSEDVVNKKKFNPRRPNGF